MIQFSMPSFVSNHSNLSSLLKVKAVCYSIVFYVLVNLVSWKKLAKYLAKISNGKGQETRQGREPLNPATGIALQHFLDKFFWSRNCLVKSLTVFYLMKKYLPKLLLKIGAEQTTDFKAHAWLEYQGLSWDIEPGKYQVLVEID